jgi:predicted metalloprotease with PDZ domain
MPQKQIRARDTQQAKPPVATGPRYRVDMPINMQRAALLALTLALAACAAEQKPASIGAILTRNNETGSLVIREVSPGLAAAQAGLLPGDELMMIDGVYTRDLDTAAVRAALRGEVGTTVRVTVVRGEKVVRLRIERGALLDAEQTRQRVPKVETIAE